MITADISPPVLYTSADGARVWLACYIYVEAFVYDLNIDDVMVVTQSSVHIRPFDDTCREPPT